MSIFEIDPDICRARTLASEFYTDPQYFELSKEKIFARSWQCVGDASASETLRPITLLPGFLDEPLLLTKNGDRVNCLSNVCTHRGKILIDEPCDANLIRCGYHGRRFSLDGKFLSMPEFEGVEDFPSETDNLPQVPFQQIGEFIFASIDPISSLDEFLDGSNIDYAAEFSGLRLMEKRTYEVDVHWALYCENYLEGFHIPYVHHGLNAIIDYGSYTTETFRYSSLQTALSESPALAGGGEVAAKYLFVFPNTMFNFYPWGISVNVVRPISPSSSAIEFFTYVREGSDGPDDLLHAVEVEDEAVVESVQRGIRSRFYSNGRYSPTREQGTHHFHGLIAEYMK